MSDTPRTVEERLAEWAKQPGAVILPRELDFIATMRQFAKEGIGYGWMQQVIEWEWASKNSHSWGPEYYDRELAAMTKRAEEAERDAQRYLWLRNERLVDFVVEDEDQGEVEMDAIDAAIDAARGKNG